MSVFRPGSGRRSAPQVIDLHQASGIEATIEPFKGLLLGVFFFSVGMGLEIGVILRDPLPLLLCAVGLVVPKAGILISLARLFGLSWPVAVECGLILAPGGEFAFVVIGLGLGSGLLSPELGAFAASLATLTMAAIPALGWAARRIKGRAERHAPPEVESASPPPGDGAGRAIVVGYGRVGQLVCEMLERHRLPYLAVDRDAAAVARWRRGGRDSVHYGDGANPLFLRSCGIREATAVIVTIDEPSGIDASVRAARGLREDVVIVSRARDAEHARRLYALGATDAVPETIEASLQLTEAALVDIGVPTGLVIASIHEKRDEFRALLKSPDETHRERRAIRARSRRGAGVRA